MQPSSHTFTNTPTGPTSNVHQYRSSFTCTPLPSFVSLPCLSLPPCVGCLWVSAYVSRIRMLTGENARRPPLKKVLYETPIFFTIELLRPLSRFRAQVPQQEERVHVCPRRPKGERQSRHASSPTLSLGISKQAAPIPLFCLEQKLLPCGTGYL